MWSSMTRTTLALALLTACAAAPLSAQSGSLGTLQTGTYICSLPGDAAGPARIVVEEETFTITNSSTYTTDEGWGTYLLTGKRITFSRGPMKGATYMWENRATLRKLDSGGRNTDLRCTRRAERR